jgi:hypothetical protein
MTASSPPLRPLVVHEEAGKKNQGLGKRVREKKPQDVCSESLLFSLLSHAMFTQ